MPTPNRRLRAAREAIPSRRVPGAHASREELAEAVALWLAEQDPRGRTYPFDANHLGKIERGVVCRPTELIRSGLRAVLGRSDDELGFATSRGYTPGAFPYPGTGGEEDDDVKRRSFLAAASAALFARPDLSGATEIPGYEPPLPSRIGASDVAALRDMATQLRTIAHTHGSYDGLLAPTVARAERLLHLPAAEPVHRDLLSVAGELHRMAGTAAFDNQAAEPCRDHLYRSMQLCSAADDPFRTAWACVIAGLDADDRGHADDSLRFFRMAQAKLPDIAPDHPGLPGLEARLHADTARAFAGVGNDGAARNELAAAVHTAPNESAAGLAYQTALLERGWGNLEAAAQHAQLAVEPRGHGPERRWPLFSRIIVADLQVAAGDSTGPALAERVISDTEASRSARVGIRIERLANTLAERGERDLAREARRVAVIG